MLTSKINLFTIFLISLSLLGSINFVDSSEYSPDFWSFNNDCFLSFNNSENLVGSQRQGFLNDSGLAGYWSFDESQGVDVYDSSGNTNNGQIKGASWVTGKYGGALSFDGVSYVNLPHSSELHFTSPFSISIWVYPKELPVKDATIIGDYNGDYKGYYLRLLPDGNLLFRIARNSDKSLSDVISGSSVSLNEWNNIVCMYDGFYSYIYINTIETKGKLFFPIDEGVSTTVIAKSQWTSGSYFSGLLDDVRLFNRTLNLSEIESLFELTNPNSFDGYYNFINSINGDIMLIRIESDVLTITDPVFVNCSRFFVDNRLVFEANDSCVINVWTNLGVPLYTSGIWNSNNHTTTLYLTSSGFQELVFTPSSPPFASNILINSTFAGSDSLFSVLWSSDWPLHGGGYIFSTNNSGIWVNATWMPFLSNSGWGNLTLRLNNTAGVIVGLKQYANNSLGLWGESDLHFIVIHSTVPSPLPSSTSPTSNPTLTVTPSPTRVPTTSPVYETPNLFWIYSALIILITILIILGLVISSKKGYISIEVVNDEKLR